MYRVICGFMPGAMLGVGHRFVQAGTELKEIWPVPGFGTLFEVIGQHRLITVRQSMMPYLQKVS